MQRMVADSSLRVAIRLPLVGNHFKDLAPVVAHPIRVGGMEDMSCV